MTEPKLTLKKRGYDSQIAIDSALIDAVIARFTGEHFNTFMHGYARVLDLPHRRPLQVRRPDGEEQEKHLVPAEPTPEEQARASRLPVHVSTLENVLNRLKGIPIDEWDEVYARCHELQSDLKAALEHPKQREVYVLSDAEIANRRLAEMSAEARAAWEAQRREDDAFVMQFCTDAITAHVRVVPGQIAVEDDEPGATVDIATGAQLVEYFSNRPGLLVNIVHTIYAENTLSDALKNALRSRSASRRSSSTPQTTATGVSPAPTAGAVESAASVELAGATASIATSPSGSTRSSR